MSLERIVQIHIAALTITGALLLSFSHSNPLLPGLVVLASVTSVLFTDVLKWFWLNRTVANIISILALVTSMGGFLQFNTRHQLLAIANLLVYLQITSLYQQKTPRNYWHLIVFSLLQVVVAAALRVGVEFGLFLAIYVAVAISTLCFFFVYREIERLQRSSDPEKPDAAPSKRRSKREPGPLSWRPAIVSLSESSRIDRKVVGAGFLRQVVAIGVTTVFFAVVLFFATPRTSRSAGGYQGAQTINMVGFSPEVRLHELDRVLQSDTPVMRATFNSMASGKPYRALDDVYFHGAALSEYHSRDETPYWSRLDRYRYGRYSERRHYRGFGNPMDSVFDRNIPADGLVALPDAPANSNMVRQSITLQPISDRILFAVTPCYATHDTQREIRADRFTAGIRRHRWSSNSVGEYRYALATSAFRGGLQLRITANDRPISPPERWSMLAYPEDRFPQLRAVARQIVQEADVDADRYTLARAMETYLASAERFNYTLDFRNVERTPGIDPIEDFVANHRSGHCEYFASALVMMLRSQGIPARMIVGYKSSEYNAVGGYHQIRQRDAHAWVEAYLENHEVENHVLPGSYVGTHGGWLRLDPTPHDDSDSLAGERGVMDVVDDVLDYAKLLWSEHILGFSGGGDRESIYRRVGQSVGSEAWKAFVKTLSWERDVAFRWIDQVMRNMGIVFVLSLGTLVSLVVYAARSRDPNPPPVVRLMQQLSRKLVGQREDGLPRAIVRQIAFYQRFESVMAELGVTRTVGQTQREFALAAASHWSQTAQDGSIDELNDRVVRAFYRIRFGHEELADDESERLNQALAQLEKKVRELKSNQSEASDTV